MRDVSWLNLGLFAVVAVPLLFCLFIVVLAKVHQRRRHEFLTGDGQHLVDPIAPTAPAPPDSRQQFTWQQYAFTGSVLAIAVAIVHYIQTSFPRETVHRLLSVAPFCLAAVVMLLIISGTFWLRRYSRISAKSIALANAGDVEAAISMLEASRAKFGDETGVLNDLSVMYSLQGEWNRALELVDAQLAKTPQLPHLYSNRGWYLYKQGRLEEAEATFRKAGPGLNDDPVQLCNYAELLVAMNRRADARQMLEAAGKALLQIKFISSEGRRQREDAIEAVRARLGF